MTVAYLQAKTAVVHSQSHRDVEKDAQIYWADTPPLMLIYYYTNKLKFSLLLI